MSNLKFKPSGVIFRESEHGDIMLADPVLKLDIIINFDFIERAASEERKAQVVADKLRTFIVTHRAERWKRAMAAIEEAESIDAEFAQNLTRYTKERTPENLRKVEKDLFFFWQKNKREA